MASKIDCRKKVVRQHRQPRPLHTLSKVFSADVLAAASVGASRWWNQAFSILHVLQANDGTKLSGSMSCTVDAACPSVGCSNFIQQELVRIGQQASVSARSASLVGRKKLGGIREVLRWECLQQLAESDSARP
ncbi:unnamed protein product [Effrenium voratum]|nr:unnamed protein product [Effrenium voratum]